MTVESIGNIADAYSNGKLPKCGMIISASREELMNLPPILYREVEVGPKEGETKCHTKKEATMETNNKLRDALKEVESTVTATLAHQPEDDEKCGQFLYDALVRVYNIADLACHEARGERDDAGI